MKDQLLNLAIQEAPDVINFLKTRWALNHPTEPTPSNEEVIAAWNAAFASSLAVDDHWIAIHGGS